MQHPQTYLVTGANSGIGLETALELARRGHAVILGVRDPGRLQAAVDTIQRAAGNSNVLGYQLELSSLRSVKQFAEAVTAHHPQLSGIVCNAGLFLDSFSWSTDGYELTWATNYLGHFYLVQLLLPLLQPSGRVVVTTSGTHDPNNHTPIPPPSWDRPEDIAMPQHALGGQPPAAYNGWQAYTNSKLCTIYLAYHLAARCQQQGLDISTFAYNPGLILSTQIWRCQPSWRMRLLSVVAPWLLWVRGMSRAISTAPFSGAFQARLACDPAFAGQTAAYFDVDRPARSSQASYDTAKAVQLWQYSEAAVQQAGLPLSLQLSAGVARTTRFHCPAAGSVDAGCSDLQKDRSGL